ncbi:glycosyltransferase family 87 protein [Oricola cellulosilytica]|uniref:glycosyltransferase family 87 protein n=1 Tax=Oricola cellulosilytica TaxID=1429082 RepID=UPI001304968A|nr:glycosyltransferase family 87 protein [Oricola cellulosilytica]
MVTYPLLGLAVTFFATGYVILANNGALPNGSPFGSDYVSFWVAAREVLAGRPEVPYSMPLFAQAQNAVFGDGNFYAFFYPPPYLAYLVPFGTLSYFPSLFLWLGLTFATALWTLVRITGYRWEVILIALAFPVTFLTIAHGQNAFLSAALFGGALVLLPTRPIVAGILIGLLTFKPQLGLLIPLALISSTNWRAFATATVTTALATGSSVILFGVETFSAFLAQGSYAMETLREGHVAWEKMVSVYAMMRVAGAPDIPAMAVQLLVSAIVAVIVIRAWRFGGGFSHEERSAMLLIGSLLATPFSLNYDLFLLAPAVAFLASDGLRNGFPSYRLSLLAATYLFPIVVLLFMAGGISIAPVVLCLLFGHVAFSPGSTRAVRTTQSTAPAK